MIINRPLHNLPAALTPFVARETERARLLEALRDPACRLITICGVGGVGKTRLALEVAGALVPTEQQPGSFAHGVYLVSLASLAAREPLDEALATSIASEVGLVLSGPESATVQLRHYLRERATLLLLDNLDHLNAAAPFIATLLEGAPALKVLATSRQRLQVRGEHVVELDGLPFPSPDARTTNAPEQYGALALFAETARALSADFALDSATLPAVEQICRLVAGLPLGVELAASWTRFLTCGEIAAEIADSLDFLANASHDMPARQHGLRAVFSSSWELLTFEEQRALRRLAVFRGSFTRAAAVAVAEVPLPLLAALVNKSLVRRAALGSESTRYVLLEVVRQYAAEQLEEAGETADTAARHALYYLSALEMQLDPLRGGGQQVALAAIGMEISQVRVAWHWAVANADAALLGPAAEALFHVYDMRSWFAEGAEVFRTAAESLAPPHSDRDTTLVYGKLLARQGWFTFHLGRQHEARTLLATSLDILRPLEQPAALVFSLNYLGAVCTYLGEYEATSVLCDESVAITTTLGDSYGKAVACNILGQMEYEREQYDAAGRWSQQSLAIEQQTGNRWSMAYSITNLGRVAYATGDYVAARDLYTQALHIREQLGDLRGVALSCCRLGDVARGLAEAQQAFERYEQGWLLFREIGNRWGMSLALLGLSRIALGAQLSPQSLALLQESLRLALETGAAPQLRAILATAALLVRQSGLAAWAGELELLPPAASATTEPYQQQAVRFLAWSLPGTPTLADALSFLRSHPFQPPVAPQQPFPLHQRPAYPANLTAREVDVLRLVAQGLTDAQVAEQLVLSTRTVSTHLSTIYSKLQVNTRSAATRFAVEHGLI